MPFNNRIIHENVRRKRKGIAPGHWYFDEGPGWICADASQGKDGAWHLTLHYTHPRKPEPTGALKFESLEAISEFLSEHFERPVVEGRLPAPEDL